MVEIIDLKQEKQEKCRVMLCQLSYDTFTWTPKHGLFYLDYNERISDKVIEFLKLAKHNSCDLVVFPELSIPEKLIERIQEWSLEQEAVVVCGSHYYSGKDGRISRCPIIVKGNVFFTEKISPSPLEKSPIIGDGITNGSKVIKFINSIIGDFAVLICSDYLDENVKSQLNLDTLDILCVPSFQKNSELYYRRMNVDCENSENGLYLLYSNFYQKQYGDGRSAVFGLMDRLFVNKLADKGYTDLNPDKKLMEFSSAIEYAIFDLDLNYKRPYANRNINTNPNFLFISTSSQTRNADLNFIQKIAHDDERYMRIDELFVPPVEYNDIIELLETNRIAFIIGDPGIGKTYTAVKILKEYFEKGYEPIWFAGLEKEERDAQSKILSSFVPSDNQIVYFEDPFGRTIFEKRDSLFQVFNPLLDRLTSLNCRILITSRKEVFEKFSQESLLEKEVLDLKRELNISKPSYSKEQLKAIFSKLGRISCTWYDQPEFRELVYQSIEENKLTSPLSIRDLVVSAKEIKELEHLAKLIGRREMEVIKAFALEIRETPIPIKTILYLIFFCGTKGKIFLSEIFSNLSHAMQKGLQGFTFNVEVRTQLGFRIEQFGFVKTAYKFSHPVYEESLASLIISDRKCCEIAKAIILEICRKDIKLGYAAINRIATKYPEVTFIMFNYLLEANYKIEDVKIKFLLCAKLISTYHSTKNVDFFNLACTFLPLPEIVEDLNEFETGWNDLLPKLNLVARYVHNSPEEFDCSIIQTIDWKSIFSQRLDNFLSPTRFVHLLYTCLLINPHSTEQLVNRVGINMIKRIYFFIDENERKKLLRYLEGLSIQDELIKLKANLEAIEKSYQGSNNGLLRKIIFSDYTYQAILRIDPGAERAIGKLWNNLLPVGILEIVGEFQAGAIIAIENSKRKIIAVGVTEYSSQDLYKIIGYQSNRFQELIGFYHVSYAVRNKLLLRFNKEKNEKYKWKASSELISLINQTSQK